MTGLLLTCLLGLAPGVQLADSAPHRRIHLVNYAQDAGLDRMTKDDLLNELNRLDRTKPTLTSPIVLLSLGGAFFISGAALVAIFTSGSSLAANTAVVLGGLFVLGGGVLLIVGVILLVTHLVAIGNYHAQVDEVQKELDYLSKLPNGQRPTELPPPPPPPPPPPGAGFIVPPPGVLVATF